MVVAFHAGLPVPGGFVGVDVFFVISGYVITGMLQREFRQIRRIQFRAFYLRRFKRLTPALALVVSVVVVLSALILSPLGPQQTATRTGVGAMLLAANVVIAQTTGGYFDAPAATNPLLHTWSLSVEEQFYLAFPLILAFGWTLARTARRLRSSPVVVVGGIAVVSFALALVGSTRPASTTSWLLGFYSPFTRAWEFAAGALLALTVSGLGVGAKRFSSALGLTGLAILTACLWLISGSTPFPSVWTLLPVSGALLLLASGLNATGVSTRLLASPPLVKVGDWSYSIYLWHWPFIVFATALWPQRPDAVLIAAVASLAPAVASYTYVENPIRRLPAMTTPLTARVVTATLAAPLLLCSAMWMTGRDGDRQPAIKDELQAISALHAAQTRGCFSEGPFNQRSTLDCVWDSRQAGTPIYLVGDSNAAQFSEAVIRAGATLGRPVRIFTTPSCPLIANLTISMVHTDELLPPDVAPTEFDHCPGYVDYTLQWLTHAPPGTVVMASLDQYWWDPNLSASLARGSASRDPAVKAALMQTGLETTISRLRAAGQNVVIVQSIPTFRDPPPIWDPRTCNATAVEHDACSRQLPRAVIDALQHDSREAVQHAAAAAGATVLDLRDDFCDRVECSTTRDGTLVYSDAAHITVAESQQLGPQFSRAIGSPA
jgi:peptidoglycan/LPS O-acetylase OafA/YrhL